MRSAPRGQPVSRSAGRTSHKSVELNRPLVMGIVSLVVVGCSVEEPINTREPPGTVGRSPPGPNGPLEAGHLNPKTRRLRRRSPGVARTREGKGFPGVFDVRACSEFAFS